MIEVRNASGPAGGTAELEVVLHTQGERISATQNDIFFDVDTVIAADHNGDPDCTVNSTINKDDTQFGFRPPLCNPNRHECDGVRALVIDFTNGTPIRDGSVLYTCRIAIAGGASGEFPMLCEAPGASDPDGTDISVTCMDGSVVVGGGPPVGEECPGDFDDSGDVTIAELVKVVNSILDGCPEP